MVRIGTRSGVSNSSDTFLLDRFRDGTIEHTDAILLRVHGPTGPLPRRRRDIPKLGVEERKRDSWEGAWIGTFYAIPKGLTWQEQYTYRDQQRERMRAGNPPEPTAPNNPPSK